jgi:3-ketosteroid 9alpha-monooxygenase subunit A
MRSGWFQVAFERELPLGVTALEVEKPLIAVRTERGIRVLDAVCPHRGAHLGHGGRIDGDAVVCPFHGYHIRMGASESSPLCIAEHLVLRVSGLVFVWLSKGTPTDLPAILNNLDKDHYFVPGFSMKVPAPAELIIENGFDAAHFQPVHAICEPPPLVVVSHTESEIRAEGIFTLLRSRGQRVTKVPYTARALSPGLILSHLGGERPYYVITAATPLGRRECLLRLSLILPSTAPSKAPDAADCEYLLEQSRKGIEKDLAIWRTISVDAPQRFLAGDDPVVEFGRFVRRFPELS